MNSKVNILKKYIIMADKYPCNKKSKYKLNMNNNTKWKQILVKKKLIVDKAPSNKNEDGCKF